MSTEVKLLLDKYSFNEFLKDSSITQGNVEFGNERYRILHTLIKLKQPKGRVAILSTRAHGAVTINDLSYTGNFSFLCSIDKANNILLYNDTYLLKDSVLDELEYKTYNIDELLSEVQAKYKKRVYQILLENIECIKKQFARFDNVYNKAKKNYSSMVEGDYLNGHKLDFYSIYIDNYVPDNTLDFLYAYLLADCKDSFINDLASRKYEEIIEAGLEYNTELYYFAEAKAKNDILKEIKEEPSDFIKLSKKIRECLTGFKHAKTFNVTTKDGDTYKVSNNYNGYEFPFVGDYKGISIEDIKQITYSRKVVFEA